MLRAVGRWAAQRLGWYGTGVPVSYSFTITNFPDVGHYSAQLFWIPNSSMQLESYCCKKNLNFQYLQQ